MINDPLEPSLSEINSVSNLFNDTSFFLISTERVFMIIDFLLFLLICK